jgi:hypothetical protein
LTFEVSALLQGCFWDVCSFAPLDLSFCLPDESDGGVVSEELEGSFDIEPCGVADGELVDWAYTAPPLKATVLAPRSASKVERIAFITFPPAALTATDVA